MRRDYRGACAVPRVMRLSNPLISVNRHGITIESGIILPAIGKIAGGLRKAGWTVVMLSR
ncbi:hypothetical protein COCNU_contig69043784G000010 [Cocos nucifera]|nr:hypothetical protein [Cocos nucifera]